MRDTAGCRGRRVHGYCTYVSRQVDKLGRVGFVVDIGMQQGSHSQERSPTAAAADKIGLYRYGYRYIDAKVEEPGRRAPQNSKYSIDQPGRPTVPRSRGCGPGQRAL